MKKILLLLLVFTISMFVIFFTLYETTWECTAKVAKGIAIGSVDTSGTIISESNYGVAGQNPIQFNLRGNGNYKLRYSDNVKRILLWSEKTKIYDGPPVAVFNVGRGALGINIHAEGKAVTRNR